MLHWSASPFQELYSAIQQEDVETQLHLINDLRDDLVSLLVHPSKNANSRRQLESQHVKFVDGSEYELNDEFSTAVARLSDELDLDEIAAAETLYYAAEGDSGRLGVAFLDLVRAAYHTRRLYILQIVAYYVCMTSSNSSDTGDHLQKDNDASSPHVHFLSILPESFDLVPSFKQIETELDSISQLVQRSRILGTYEAEPSLAKAMAFCRDSLFREMQLLGEVLWGLAKPNSKPGLTLGSFQSLVDHILTFQPDDLFCLTFLPGLLRHISNLSISWPDSDIILLHVQVLKDTSDSKKLAESPFKALIITAFLTNFISWCKKDPSRVKQFPFDSSVSDPIKKAISVGGSMEMLLGIAADTSLVSTALSDRRALPFYDFRPFLQRHIPKLKPIRLLDINEAATSELRRSLQIVGNLPDDADLSPVYYHCKEFPLNDHFISFLAPILSSFALNFVANAAFVLSDLRDTEEDLLLSSEELDLDAMAENADLERFYVAMFYIYLERPQLAALFWADKSSSAYGFLQWASRCNSPLIISTFCLFLSSLASGKDNAVNTFNFLQITNDKSSVTLSTTSTSSIMGKFSSVSWSTIYSSLAYYNKVLSGGSKETSSTTAITEVGSFSSLVPQLGDDSIIYISGFFQVLSEVARNSEQARSGLLLSDDYQLLRILTDFLNNSTPLGGAAMVVLSSLVGGSIKDRRRVWQLLDNWLFRNQIRGRHPNRRPQDVIRSNLTSYSLVMGFATLIDELLKPVSDSKALFDPYELYFPLDLGSRIRRPGIWAYLDALSTDIFVQVMHSDMDADKKVSLQLAIVELWEHCLSQLDPNLVLNAAAAHLKDLDNICANHSIIQYLQAQQGSAVMCFLYRPKVHNSLFELASLGLDAVNELAESSKKVLLVQKSLNLISMVLDRQLFFADELLPILRLSDNRFCLPSDVETCGIRSFYDSLLLKLPFVSHIALYVSSSKCDLAITALQLLKKIACSPAFNGLDSQASYNLLSKNRLLTMLETVDESKRIRFSFLEQFEAPISDAQSVGLKIDILRFLNSNLIPGSSRPSITHFLLGFDTRRMNLGDKNEDGTVLSSKSLLKTLLFVLRDTATLMGDASNIDFAPSQMCSLTLELILKLCDSEIFGNQVLEFMRSGLGPNINLVADLMVSAKKVYGDTYFSGKQFNPDFRIGNRFVAEGDSTAAFIAFTAYRSRLLQLVALELHSVSESGCLSLTSRYTDLLINSGSLATGSPKILELLDLVEFKPHNMIEKVDQLFAGFDFRYVLQRIRLKSEPGSSTESVYDLTVVDDLISLFGKESQALNVLHRSEVSSNLALFDRERSRLRYIISCTVSFDNLRVQQLEYIHSWVMLTQVIVSDGKIDSSRRNNVILEVFQYVIPKIVDYLKHEAMYAEDLVSLCVSLLRVYVSSKVADMSLDSIASLAFAALTGILTPQSTPSLRSNFYVLVTSYIQQASTSKSALTELLIYIRSIDQRFFHVVCNDSLVAEGPCRVAALFLLECLVKAATQLQGSSLDRNFIMGILCKSNYLYLLVQKLKSTDAIFCECLVDETSNKKRSVDLQTLLYELTTSKTSLYLLIRIAQTRFGAQQLLNCDLFTVIKDCHFLTFDPDLGFQLALEEQPCQKYLQSERTSVQPEHQISQSSSSQPSVTDSAFSNGSQSVRPIRLRMSLDTPLSLNEPDSGSSRLFSTTTISYYDIFVPVFRLVTAVVISLGPQNETSIKQASDLEKHFSKLITAVLKRQIVIEERNIDEVDANKSSILGEDSANLVNVRGSVKELASLFILLDSLVL
ncbi:hypothetical protein FOA43_001469 [Brettanomyces nanus]|uniref:Uncharacterized protein n=1 Tax=Eeniella nana TaxID=13502 RepID=A0A875S1D1_EENNA|nr:uncharacterized protein FOA43_001469 [Brettanomyces nanus]QPG74145.1 hypothetical protein FOA43_001469 [Brettanomyces nanus]